MGPGSAWKIYSSNSPVKRQIYSYILLIHGQPGEVPGLWLHYSNIIGDTQTLGWDRPMKKHGGARVISPDRQSAKCQWRQPGPRPLKIQPPFYFLGWKQWKKSDETFQNTSDKREGFVHPQFATYTNSSRVSPFTRPQTQTLTFEIYRSRKHIIPTWCYPTS